MPLRSYKKRRHSRRTRWGGDGEGASSDDSNTITVNGLTTFKPDATLTEAQQKSHDIVNSKIKELGTANRMKAASTITTALHKGLINIRDKKETFKKIEAYINDNKLEDKYLEYVNNGKWDENLELEKLVEFTAAFSLLLDNCSQDNCDSTKKEHEMHLFVNNGLIINSVSKNDTVPLDEEKVESVQTELDNLIAEKKKEILRKIGEEPAAATTPSSTTTPSSSSYDETEDWSALAPQSQQSSSTTPPSSSSSLPPTREGDDMSGMMNINKPASSPGPENGPFDLPHNGLSVKIDVGVGNDPESEKPALFLGDVTIASNTYDKTNINESNRLNSQNVGTKLMNAVESANKDDIVKTLWPLAQQGYNYTDEDRGRDIFDKAERKASDEFYEKTRKAKEEESQAVAEGNIQATKDSIKKNGTSLSNAATRLNELLKMILDKIDAAIEDENDTKPIDASITKAVANIKNLKEKFVDKYIEGINSLLAIYTTPAFIGVEGMSKDEILNKELRDELHIADTIFDQLTDDNSNNLVVVNRLIKAIMGIVTKYNNKLETASKYTFEKVEYGVHMSNEYTLQCIPPKQFFGSSKPIQFTGIGDTFIEKFFSSKVVAPFEKPDTLETANKALLYWESNRSFSAELRRSSAERAKWGKEIKARDDYHTARREAAYKKNFGSDTSTWGKTKKFFGDTRRKYLGFGNGGRRTRKSKKSRKSRKVRGGKNRRHSRKH